MRLRGVRSRWNETDRCWQFRAVRDIDNQRRVGPWRRSPEVASLDYQALEKAAAALPARIATLEEACEAVARDQIAVGVPEANVDRSTRVHARFLCDMLGGATRISDIEVEDGVRMCTVAVAAGRSPNTLLQKELPLLGRAMRAAEVDDLVPAIRERLKHTLKYVPPQMVFFTGDELAAVLKRMREATTTDGNGRVVPVAARDRDADLVHLMAMTGVRTGELSRITVADADIARGTLEVRHAKDKSHPRTLFLRGEPLEALRRLTEAAAAREPGRRPDQVPLLRNAGTVLNCMFKRWQKRLAIRKLNGRALRHSYATGTIGAGGSVADTAALLGHRRISTTDRYAHAVQDRLASVAGAWIDQVSGLLDGQRPGSPGPEQPGLPGPESDGAPNPAGPTAGTAGSAS